MDMASLIALGWAKPVGKRQKNDTADAGADLRSGPEPTLRLVAVWSEEEQVAGMVGFARNILAVEITIQDSTAAWFGDPISRRCRASALAGRFGENGVRPATSGA
ncbi:hypothetical protein [Mesorhizobium carmichaelinearum]|uniref:hypothetical protein n=1 Tax=Mesorhizobium carmichaelinearum TaxID=1208188 RepID=UPI00117C9436|nr:hypothetical protein [Mesorhizobium carmichaelinearum]